MSGIVPSSGFDLSPWLAANAALAARIVERRDRGSGLGAMLSGLSGRGITGKPDEERARRLKTIGARGGKASAEETSLPLGLSGDVVGRASRINGSALVGAAGHEAGLSSAALLARGYQPAVVKVISYAHGVTRATASAQYVERDEVQLETHEGKHLPGKEAVAEEIRAWSSSFEKRSPSQDVVSVRVQLSGLSNIFEDRALLAQAVGAAFEGHRHAVRLDVQKDGVLEARVVAVMARQITPEERIRAGRESGANRMAPPALPPRLRVVEQRIGAGEDAPMRRVFDARSEASMKARIVEKTGYPAHGVSLEPGAPGHGRDAVGQRLATLVAKAPALDHQGKPLRTADDIREESRDWARHLRSQTPRDTMHMVVSAKAGTDVKAFTHAVRAFLQDTFSNHKFMFGVHTDKLEAGHIHAHAIVAVRGENGAKLHPGPSDLAQWRVSYAAHARAHGLEVVATRAAEQASSRSYGPKDKSIVDAALSPRPERKEQDRAYASDPRNAGLIKGAMKRMETARANPVRIPQTERELAGMKQSLDHWQAEAKANPANALASSMVERLSAAHGAGAALHGLRNAVKSSTQEPHDQGKMRGSVLGGVNDVPAKNAKDQEEHLLFLNKQVNEASALLPAASRARFLEQTEAHLNALAERLDRQRAREAVAIEDQEAVTPGAMFAGKTAAKSKGQSPQGSSPPHSKGSDALAEAAATGANAGQKAGNESPATHSTATGDSVADIQHRQMKLLQQAKCAYEGQRLNTQGHEPGD